MARVSVVVATVGIGLLVAAAGTSGNQRSCPTGPAKAPVVEYVAALVCFVVAAAAGMTRFSGPRLDFRWGQKLAYGGVVLSFLVLIQLVTRVCGD
jgi:hypothetical protein